MDCSASIPQRIEGYDSRDMNISEAVKELIVGSYNIYKDLLSEPYPVTIVCGGQSPAYYCLAMMNFKIYDPKKVDIVILPHSKGGVTSTPEEKMEENIKYAQRLRDKNIKVKDNVVIIDGVHSGVGILALESALTEYFKNVSIKKIAINVGPDIAKIKVDKTYYLKYEPYFSDDFPRIVNSYHPADFDDATKFVTQFNTKKNIVADMIVQLAVNYPNSDIEQTDWYKLNDILPEKFKLKKIKEEEHEKSMRILFKKNIESCNTKKSINTEFNNYLNFVPIVLYRQYGKIYECPSCKFCSGSLLVIIHHYLCDYKNKIPME